MSQPKYFYNLSVFQKEDDLSYYLLGAFCTDGSIYIGERNRGRATLVSKDTNWIELINSKIAPNKKLDLDRGTYRIVWNSKEIADWFVAHGCYPNKSLTLTLPDIPEQYIADFIRGCWDGDGTVGVYKSFRIKRNYTETVLSCKLYTGSIMFAKNLQEILLRFNIKSSIITRVQSIRKINNRIITSCNPNYVLTIRDKNSIYNFCNKIYYQDCKLFMHRKFEISKLLKNECMTLRNKSILQQ